MQSYAKKYEGHEQEILRDIKLHGRFGAMSKWKGHVIPWEKFIHELLPPTVDSTTAVAIATPKELTISGLFTNAENLAIQLVDAFSQKIVELKTRCAQQERRIDFLETQLAMYKDRNDERLADKMVEALGIITRA